ncbi:MAG: acyl-CoA dehydrogenase family protein [Thermoanaerobaculia bacterium]
MDSVKSPVAEPPHATEAPSFLKSLFQGEFQEEMVFPFPEIPPDVKETVGAFSEAYTDFDAANIDSEKIDRDHFFPREAIKAMGELGVLGMTIPEEYGGSGFSSSAYGRMTEVIGVLDASASIVVGAHQSIGLKPLLLFGTEEQKKKWLPDLAVGKLVGAFCLTEPEAGSDAGSLMTTAVYDAKTDEYVLNGTKQWISNGGFASFLTVFARIPGSAEGKDPQKEIVCFAVVTNPDGTLPGLSRGAEEKKLGLCASSTCQIILENCRVPAFNLIGGKGRGFKVALETLNTGRMSLGAGAVGGSKMMIKLAAEHATQRRQFKTRIADFEMIRHKITRMTAKTYALEAMSYLTAGLIDRKGIDYSLEGACCKVFGTEVLWENINDALQIAGGNGFMNEYPYGRALRDSRINMIFEGTNEILRMLIALSGFKELGDQLKEVQHALKSPLRERGVLAEYGKKRMKGVITRDKLTKVHPSLAPEAEQVAKYAGIFANAAETILRKHGKRVVDREYQHERLADVVIYLYAQIAVLSRVTSSIAKKGEEKAAGEIEIARWFCHEALHRMVGNLKALDRNRDELTTRISDHVWEALGYPYDLWA